MTKQIYTSALAILTVLVLSAAPAQASSVPCSGKHGCRLHLEVERKVHTWESPTHPSWRNVHEMRALAVYVEGDRLSPGVPLKACIGEFIGHGVSIRVNSCQRDRIRVRSVAWGRPRRALVYFRV